MERAVELGNKTPPVRRLGLASRGNTHLRPEDVHGAFQAGVGYVNWCTHEDGVSRAIADLDDDARRRIVVAAQLYARTGEEAKRELDRHLRILDTSWIDVLTFYYVEAEAEWAEIERGALPVLRTAQADGRVRLIGLTTHQRPLAAELAKRGLLDLLMIRYNAAHRGAERDLFPVTVARRLPVVCFTCLRWGGLLAATPEDPPGFQPPPALEWYRFCLANPAVSVALMAPNDRTELEENLRLFEDWRPPTSKGRAVLLAHGDRVHRHGGGFA